MPSAERVQVAVVCGGARRDHRVAKGGRQMQVVMLLEHPDEDRHHRCDEFAAQIIYASDTSENRFGASTPVIPTTVPERRCRDRTRATGVFGG